MFNKHTLNSGYRVRMFHVNALNDSTKEQLCRMWNELCKEEIKMVLQNETTAIILRDHVKEDMLFSVDSDKFNAYLAELEWIYILGTEALHPVLTDIGFMTVTKDRQILSLWVNRFLRGLGLAKYLVSNHLEIFNTDVSLQCFKNNQHALEFYKSLGFTPSYTPNPEAAGDLYYTLVKKV